MSSKRLVVTVQPHAGRWRVRFGNGSKIATDFSHKEDALVVAREFCRREQAHGGLAQLRVHGRDGKIQTEHTYGADPRRHVG